MNSYPALGKRKPRTESKPSLEHTELPGGADSVITMTGKRHAPVRAIEVINRDDAGGQYALRFTNYGLTFTNDDPHDPTRLMSHDDGLVYKALVKGRAVNGAGDLSDAATRGEDR